MKTYIKQSVIAATLFVTSTMASAAVVGVENPGNINTDVKVTRTTYSYDATTQVFLVEGVGVFDATYNSGANAKFISPDNSGEYQFAAYVDSNGDFTTGAAGAQISSKVGFGDITVNTVRMVGDTDNGTDISILEGEVLDFGWDGNDVIDALFSVVTAQDSDLFQIALAGFVLTDDSNPIDFSSSFGFGFDGSFFRESDTFGVSATPVAVSEPAAIVLMLGGCLMMIGFRTRKLTSNS